MHNSNNAAKQTSPIITNRMSAIAAAKIMTRYDNCFSSRACSIIKALIFGYSVNIMLIVSSMKKTNGKEDNLYVCLQKSQFAKGMNLDVIKKLLDRNIEAIQQNVLPKVSPSTLSETTPSNTLPKESPDTLPNESPGTSPETTPSNTLSEVPPSTLPTATSSNTVPKASSATLGKRESMSADDAARMDAIMAYLRRCSKAPAPQCGRVEKRKVLSVIVEESKEELENISEKSKYIGEEPEVIYERSYQ